MGKQTRFLLDRFERDPERILFVDARDDTTLTYGAFHLLSRRAAAWLRDLGVAPGDAVALSTFNCLEAATLAFGCFHLGAQLLPINPDFHPEVVAELLDALRPRLLLTTPLVRSKLDPELQARPDLPVHCFYPATARRKARLNDFATVELAEALAACEPAESCWAEQDDEFGFMTVFSSGTSSTPKGITLCYRGLVGNGRAFTTHMGIGAECRFYNVLPITYLGGLYNLMLLPIIGGGSIVMDGVFGVPNVYAFWETVRDREVTALWFSPAMLSILLSLEDEIDLGFLREQIQIGLVGMAPLAIDLKRRFEERFGFMLYENYGLSETTFLATNHPGLDYKPGSVGHILDGVEVRLVDEQGADVPQGEVGQIQARTPYLMRGYAHAGEGDQLSVQPDGSFYTGDLGYFDDGGELFVSGRLKDLIIRGGVNISPKQIEDVVYRLPGIEDAAVVGFAHPVYGEDVVLAVTLTPEGQERLDVPAVEAHCSAHLANFQRPKRTYVLESMPKGATGKIQKSDVKQALFERCGDPFAGEGTP